MDKTLSDKEILSSVHAILTSCANALEALPTPASPILDKILEEIWVQIDDLLSANPRQKKEPTS